jgi:hypothetical protein
MPVIYVGNRLSWTLVIAIVYATLVFVLTDIVWRTVEMSIIFVVAGAACVFAAGEAAIWLLGGKKAGK